jgi:hypothetical protein
MYSDDSGEEKPTLVFENPDGSLHHALPTGTRYKKAHPDTPPAERLAREWISWDPELMILIERIYSRHERVFIVLLFLQFLLENSFNALLIKHRDSTTTQITKSYSFVHETYAPIVFWVLVGSSALFSCAYYILAAVAAWERRSMYMRIFSDIAMVGILGQVLFAYINRFNIILFLLRFVVFAHSRFLLSVLNGSARIVMSTIQNNSNSATSTSGSQTNQPTIVIEV